MNNLNLGYTISLPFDNNENDTIYKLEDINIIKSLSKNFNCIQIMFTKTKLSLLEIKNIKKLLKNYKNIFIHSSYQINIGTDLVPSQTDLYNTSIDILINEIELAKKIKAKGIVVHMGKNVKKKFDNEHVYNNMVEFIIEFFKKIKTKKINTSILLETSAGQGGEMCSNLNDFVNFILKFSKLYFYYQLNICIDTCHIFQAGYDINNIKIINQVHKIFYPIKDKIKLIHLNDSYYSVGSHIDRHEQIGKGMIQVDKLIKFIYPYKTIPMILETIGPYEDQLSFLSNI